MLWSGTDLAAESSEAMQIKCFARGHKIFIQPNFETSIYVSINRVLSHATNVQQKAGNYIAT